MLSSRKAISDIVAVMLMILIVMAGTTIFYVYSMGLFGSLQGAQPQTPYTKQIALDNYIWINSTSNSNLQTLNLTLRNTGKASVTLADFFINGTKIPSGSVTYQVGCSSPPGVLAIQASCVVTLSGLDVTVGVRSGMAYSVKVVTVDGAIFTFSCIAGDLTR